VDDVHLGHLDQADRPAARRDVRRRDPNVGFEFGEVHDDERRGHRLGADRQPAQAGVGPALLD
jgi:hypothetical protein